MTEDRRALAEMVRPLGIGDLARRRDLWTPLEAVAWIASHGDLRLVSGVANYKSPFAAVAPELNEGAQVTAVIMDIEQAFCRCGGDSHRIYKDGRIVCTCFGDASAKLFKACADGDVIDRAATASAGGRLHWASATLDNRGLRFTDDKERHPLFAQTDIVRRWPKDRGYRRKSPRGVPVPINDMVPIFREAGNIGQRRLFEVASAAFPDRPILQKAFREACQLAFPNKAKGRPQLMR